jgi:hypothetical protein
MDGFGDNEHEGDHAVVEADFDSFAIHFTMLGPPILKARFFGQNIV